MPVSNNQRFENDIRPEDHVDLKTRGQRPLGGVYRGRDRI